MRNPSSLLLNYSLVNKKNLDNKFSTIFVREKSNMRVVPPTTQYPWPWSKLSVFGQKIDLIGGYFVLYAFVWLGKSM